MARAFKLIFIILLMSAVALLCFACNDNKVDYSKIEKITVDETSIAEGFLLSEFDISKVLLNVQYKASTDASGKEVAGEIIQIPATLSMVKAEDKAKLSIPGTNNITLIYGKFSIEFSLRLYDDTVQKYKVLFLDDAGNALGDTQYVVAGGKAIQPALPTKQGYTFIGWFDRETGKYSSFDNIQKNTTLTATYAPDFYEVTFSRLINEEETEISKINVPRGENAYDYAPEIPIVSGYSNGRWSNIDAMADVNASGLKFYAIYDRDQVNVTFIYKKSSEADTKEALTYEVNGEIINPPSAERIGYKFVCWQANGTEISFPYKVTNEMTFTAKYIDINVGNSGLQYTTTTGGCEVSGYNGEESVVVIPETAMVGGQKYDVVDVVDGVFKDCVIEEYVVSANNNNFVTEDGVLYNRMKTKLIAYPSAKPYTGFTPASTVTEISGYAFYKAKALLSINLPVSLKIIGSYAFSECNSLEYIEITKAITTIEEGAFKMTSLDAAVASLTFDSASVLTDIGDEAFYGLDKISVVNLPSSLTNLGAMAFYGCKLLTEITATNNDAFKLSDNGALYNVAMTQLYAFPATYKYLAGSEFVVDAKCNTIMSGAFSFAKLSTIKISSNIVLQDNAIVCPNLDSIRILSDSINVSTQSFGTFVPSQIFVKTNNLSSMQSMFTDSVFEYIEENWNDAENYYSDYIYKAENVVRYENGTRKESIEITILGSRNSTPNLNIPDTIDSYKVTKIADNAFYGDNIIENVTFPVNLLHIGKYAFYNASMLQTVKFNESLKTVDDYSFSGCSRLNEITFDAGLEITSFGIGVMDDTAWINNTEEEFLIIGGVLVKYTGLNVSATIPETVKYIATNAFKGKSNLTSVIIDGTNLKTISYRAFQYCTGLAEMTFPSSLQYIAKEAFYKCNYLFAVFYTDISSTSETLTVDTDAFKKHDTSFDDEVYQIYEDTVLYDLSYYSDEYETTTFKGIAFVTPHFVDNTGDTRFAGWYTDINRTNIAKFPLYITENTTLYAKWIKITESTSGLRYELTNNNTYAVVGYSGTDSYIIVPETYKGKNVTEIADNAFLNLDYIVNVELPNMRVAATGEYLSRIISVGEDAFKGTYWYNNFQGDFVMIDDILIKYKGTAEEVLIPAGINRIAKGAFKDNDFIVKITLSEGITMLDDSVFEGCDNLMTVILNENLLQINSKVFMNCQKLQFIDFSICTALSTIGHDAFDNTYWLNTVIDDCILIGDILYKYQGNAQELHIANGITSIGEKAFMNNSSLENVFIPESVEAIGISAFENCNRLFYVNLFAGGNRLTRILSRAFYNCVNLQKFDLSTANNLLSIADYAFAECVSYETLKLPAITESMDEYAFYNSGLKRIIVSEGSSITELPAYCFAECFSLESIVFNGKNNLISVGEYAFNLCAALRDFVNTSANIESFGDGAFYNCSSLINFSINESALVSIGNDALYGAGYVSQNHSNLVVLGNILISYNGSDKEIMIPANITYIYNKAFYGNTNITTINFEEGSVLTGINSEAFANCSKLQTINFPSTIVYVGSDVMTGTKWYSDRGNEKFVAIGGTLIKYNSTKTEQVIIPDYISVINGNAFNGASLYDITIGEHVTKIENGAFDGIDSMTNWTITMLSSNPPILKEDAPIAASEILLNDSDAIESYRLDSGWAVQYAAEKLKVITKFEVTFVIPADQADQIPEVNMHGIYDVIEVNAYETDDTSYLFTGWYLDSEFITPISYPMILSGDITIYAKIIDRSVGSNPGSYTNVSLNATTAEIVNYDFYYDTKVVIIAESMGLNIVSLGQGYRQAEDGIYIYSAGDYIEDPSSGETKYAYLGAFERHIELEEIYFANGSVLHTIGVNAFKDCTSLKKIVIPSTIKHIKTGAFENCTSLSEIVFEGSISDVEIEEGAFANCTALASFTLPSGVTQLAENAFSGCTALKVIYVNAYSPINLGDIMPFEIVEGMIVYIPYGRTSIYTTSWAAYADYLQEMPNVEDGE